MRAARPALAALAAAAGGSACGSFFLVAPVALTGTSGDAWPLAPVIFAVSLPMAEGERSRA